MGEADLSSTAIGATAADIVHFAKDRIRNPSTASLKQWNNATVRATRVIYVENDPALRGIMTSMLDSAPELEVLLSTGSPAEALAFVPPAPADVALLDLALGVDEMNGIDLGIALRQVSPHIGIVIHSQYPLDFTVERVPQELRMGWSTLQKSGQMEVADLVNLLKTTAMGIANMHHDVAWDPDGAEHGKHSKLARLSSRQRSIMGLTAGGFTPQQVAEQLALSHEVVRQDLVRAYKVLVPEQAGGKDRRTQAVLTYVRLTRDEQWDSP